MLTEEQMRDALRQCPHDAVENLRVRWLYAKDFARAIESAACAERDARIAELTGELEEARRKATEDAYEFNRAINFAIEQGLEACHFLTAWREGDPSGWPEFDAAIKEQT